MLRNLVFVCVVDLNSTDVQNDPVFFEGYQRDDEHHLHQNQNEPSPSIIFIHFNLLIDYWYNWYISP
jgi:hypothetical protein